eukprot:gene19071-20986_t
MLSSRQPKQNLSKNLLQMKFMQRKREEILKEEEDKQYRDKLNKEHWYLDDINEEDLKDAAEMEPSFVICEDLLPMGRMSFKNFNPNVEKTYHELLRKRDTKIRGLKEDEESISDEEMAQRYESLVNTVSKKFNRKRKQKNCSSSDDEATTTMMATKKNKKQKVAAFRKPKIE